MYRQCVCVWRRSVLSVDVRTSHNQPLCVAAGVDPREDQKVVECWQSWVLSYHPDGRTFLPPAELEAQAHSRERRWQDEASRQMGVLAAIRECEERYRAWGTSDARKAAVAKAQPLYAQVRACYVDLAGQKTITKSQSVHLDLLNQTRDPSAW